MLLTKFRAPGEDGSPRSSGEESWQCNRYECGQLVCPLDIVPCENVIFVWSPRFNRSNHHFHISRFGGIPYGQKVKVLLKNLRLQSFKPNVRVRDVSQSVCIRVTEFVAFLWSVFHLLILF